jgi:hypothetical protein
MKTTTAITIHAVIALAQPAALPLRGQVEGENGLPRPPVLVSGGIVALVGDEIITQAELDRHMERRRSDFVKFYPPGVIDREWEQLLRIELERLINDKLVLQLVKKEEDRSKGAPYITDAQLEDQIEKRVEEMQGRGVALTGPEELYRFYFESFGMTREEVRDHLRKQMAIGAYFWREVYSGANSFVSPKEAQYYYRDHKDDFSTPERVSFRMLVISRSRSDFPFAVENVDKELQAGADFLDVAREWSDESVVEGNPRGAGKLWDRTFDQVRDWSDAMVDMLAKMKQGDVSPRLDTPTGAHYFKVEDIVKSEPKSFSEAQAEIRKRILVKRRERAQEEFLAQLRKRTRIEVLLPPLKVATPAKEPAPAAGDAGPPAPGGAEGGNGAVENGREE